MFKIMLVLCLYFCQAVPTKRYHAFQLSTAGKDVMVNLETARYTSCSIEIKASSKEFSIGQEIYSIDYTEPFVDTLRAYFGHRMQGARQIACSLIRLPAGKTRADTLLFTWEDSTKAFQATLISKK